MKDTILKDLDYIISLIKSLETKVKDMQTKKIPKAGNVVRVFLQDEIAKYKVFVQPIQTGGYVVGLLNLERDSSMNGMVKLETSTITEEAWQSLIGNLSYEIL